MQPHLEIVGRETGTGASSRPPLLFVHGICAAAWCWEEYFLGYFADNGFDSYALSLRGHGGSGGQGRLRWTSTSDYVDDLVRAAAGLASPPVVIGHSFGSLVVRKYLETHRPPAAALLAPTPMGGMIRISTRLSSRHPWLSLLICLTLEPGRLLSTPRRARDFLFSPAVDEEVAGRYAGRLGRESFRAFTGMIFNRPDPAPVRNVPMLVLGGELDRLIPPSGIPGLAQAYGAESRVLPWIAHNLMLDPRWEDAAAVLLEWLVRVFDPSQASSVGY